MEFSNLGRSHLRFATNYEKRKVWLDVGAVVPVAGEATNRVAS